MQQFLIVTKPFLDSFSYCAVFSILVPTLSEAESFKMAPDLLVPPFLRQFCQILIETLMDRSTALGLNVHVTIRKIMIQ